MFPLGFFMIHDSSWCCHNHIAVWYKRTIRLISQNQLFTWHTQTGEKVVNHLTISQCLGWEHQNGERLHHICSNVLSDWQQSYQPDDHQRFRILRCSLIQHRYLTHKVKFQSITHAYHVSSWRSRISQWLWSTAGSRPGVCRAFQHCWCFSRHQPKRSCEPF